MSRLQIMIMIQNSDENNKSQQNQPKQNWRQATHKKFKRKPPNKNELHSARYLLLMRKIQKIKKSRNLLYTISHSNPDFICAICLKYLLRSMTTLCAHSFCAMCINEHFLFFDQCFICGQSIRKGKLTYNRVLDSLVENFVNNCHKDSLIEWKRRIQAYKSWENNRKLNILTIGSKVDVRDPRFIWCVGTIINMVIKDKTRYLIIKYNQRQQFYNEQISLNSGRLARFEYYTTRDDIPRYEQGSENAKIIFNAGTRQYPQFLSIQDEE